jgi:hypothetical protein
LKAGKRLMAASPGYLNALFPRRAGQIIVSSTMGIIAIESFSIPDNSFTSHTWQKRSVPWKNRSEKLWQLLSVTT